MQFQRRSDIYDVEWIDNYILQERIDGDVSFLWSKLCRCYIHADNSLTTFFHQPIHCSTSTPVNRNSQTASSLHGVGAQFTGLELSSCASWHIQALALSYIQPLEGDSPSPTHGILFVIDHSSTSRVAAYIHTLPLIRRIVHIATHATNITLLRCYHVHPCPDTRQPYSLLYTSNLQRLGLWKQRWIISPRHPCRKITSSAAIKKVPVAGKYQFVWTAACTTYTAIRRKLPTRATILSRRQGWHFKMAVKLGKESNRYTTVSIACQSPTFSSWKSYIASTRVSNLRPNQVHHKASESRILHEEERGDERRG